MEAHNLIVQLIHEKMKADGWDAYTPDSYASYLFSLSDEEIRAFVRDHDDDE